MSLIDLVGYAGIISVAFAVIVGMAIELPRALRSR